MNEPTMPPIKAELEDGPSQSHNQVESNSQVGKMEDSVSKIEHQQCEALTQSVSQVQSYNSLEMMQSRDLTESTFADAQSHFDHEAQTQEEIKPMENFQQSLATDITALTPLSSSDPKEHEQIDHMEDSQANIKQELQQTYFESHQLQERQDQSHQLTGFEFEVSQQFDESSVQVSPDFEMKMNSPSSNKRHLNDDATDQLHDEMHTNKKAKSTDTDLQPILDLPVLPALSVQDEPEIEEAFKNTTDHDSDMPEAPLASTQTFSGDALASAVLFKAQSFSPKSEMKNIDQTPAAVSNTDTELPIPTTQPGEPLDGVTGDTSPMSDLSSLTPSVGSQEVSAVGSHPGQGLAAPPIEQSASLDFTTVSPKTSEPNEAVPGETSNVTPRPATTSKLSDQPEGSIDASDLAPAITSHDMDAFITAEDGEVLQTPQTPIKFASQGIRGEQGQTTPVTPPQKGKNKKKVVMVTDPAFLEAQETQPLARDTRETIQSPPATPASNRTENLQVETEQSSSSDPEKNSIPDAEIIKSPSRSQRNTRGEADTNDHTKVLPTESKNKSSKSDSENSTTIKTQGRKIRATSMSNKELSDPSLTEDLIESPSKPPQKAKTAGRPTTRAQNAIHQCHSTPPPEVPLDTPRKATKKSKIQTRSGNHVEPAPGTTKRLASVALSEAEGFVDIDNYIPDIPDKRRKIGQTTQNASSANDSKTTGTPTGPKTEAGLPPSEKKGKAGKKIAPRSGVISLEDEQPLNASEVVKLHSRKKSAARATGSSPSAPIEICEDTRRREISPSPSSKNGDTDPDYHPNNPFQSVDLISNAEEAEIIPAKARVELLKGPFNGFPRFESGNVYIKLALLDEHSAHRLHSEVLSRVSSWFESELQWQTPEANTRFAKKVQQKTGVTFRFELSDLDLETGSCFLSRTPITQYTNDHDAVEAQKMAQNLDYHQRREDVIEAHSNMFRTFYLRPPVIDQQDMQKAFKQADLLLTVTSHYNALEIVRPYVLSALMEFGRYLPKAIQQSPIQWINLSIALKSAPILREAIIHVVGNCRQWGTETLNHPGISPEIKTLIKKKGSTLKRMKAEIDKALFTSAVHINGKNVMFSRVDQRTTNTWLVVQYWRDWYSQSLHNAARSAANIDGDMYRKMGKGGDAYLSSMSMAAMIENVTAGRVDVPAHDELDEDMKFMKDYAMKMVKPLCVNESMLPVDEEGITYFTCIKVEDSELPWMANV